MESNTEDRDASSPTSNSVLPKSFEGKRSWLSFKLKRMLESFKGLGKRGEGIDTGDSKIWQGL